MKRFHFGHFIFLLFHFYPCYASNLLVTSSNSVSEMITMKKMKQSQKNQGGI